MEGSGANSLVGYFLKMYVKMKESGRFGGGVPVAPLDPPMQRNIIMLQAIANIKLLHCVIEDGFIQKFILST